MPITLPLVFLQGGGVKRWLKEEIPLEDRKKILNRLKSPNSSTSNVQLSTQYLFVVLNAGILNGYISKNINL